MVGVLDSTTKEGVDPAEGLSTEEGDVRGRVVLAAGPERGGKEKREDQEGSSHGEGILSRGSIGVRRKCCGAWKVHSMEIIGPHPLFALGSSGGGKGGVERAQPV